MKIKQLPTSERPVERCIQYGSHSLTDAQLLAVILRTGSSGKDAISLSEELLSLKENSLLSLTKLSRKELLSVKGIGIVKAIQIECLIELSIRLSQVKAKSKFVASNPQTIANYYMQRLRFKTQEEVVVLFLDTKCSILSEETITVGTVNASLISPREIFLSALNHNASLIVLLHNHPSGNPSPSQDDIKISKNISECGKMLGIQLLDHIIIGDNNYISMKEAKLL